MTAYDFAVIQLLKDVRKTDAKADMESLLGWLFMHAYDQRHAPNNFTLVLIQRFIMEMYHMRRGVTVVVEDTDLMQAILRTEYKCQVGDVHLPFTSIEFVFPQGLTLPGTELKMPAALICDVNEVTKFDVGKAFNLSHDLTDLLDGLKNKMDKTFGDDPCVRGVYGPTVLKRDAKTGQTGVDGMTSIVRGTDPIAHVEDISKMEDDEYVAKGLYVYGRDDSIKLCDGVMKAVFGTLLYIQSQKEHQALQPVTPARRTGLPAIHARVYKKRKEFKLQDMLTPRKGVTEDPGHTGLKHASPRSHWRSGSFHVLRHERYKRNPDGSSRVVWVRPSLVNARETETVRSFRKLEHEEATV